MPVEDVRLHQLRRDLAHSGGRLYTGLGAGGLTFAGPQQALLVLGPPRSGKTTTLVVPNVLAAPGSVISTSTKPDVLAMTLASRSAHGRCWLLDPTGTVRPPDGVTSVRWSPVCAAATWDEALATAHAMVGAARPGSQRGDAGHWSERAEALLAPLLHAAALTTSGMRTVVGWVHCHDAGPARATLTGHGHDLAAEVLAGIMATEHREQSSIWSTAAGVLAAYRSTAALETAVETNFDPRRLAAGSETVYVCAPARHQALVAPLIVAFLEQVRAGAYALAAEDANGGVYGRPPVTLALDEVANIAPLPDLPAMVSEGGGQGVLTLAALQDLSQARQRWGPAADGFLSLFGTKLVLPGIADLATLELVSRLAGEIDLPTRSVSRGPWWVGRRASSETWSVHRQRRLPVDAINQLGAGSALVLSGREPPARVWLRPWSTTTPFAPLPDPIAPCRPIGRHAERGLS